MGTKQALEELKNTEIKATMDENGTARVDISGKIPDILLLVTHVAYKAIEKADTTKAKLKYVSMMEEAVAVIRKVTESSFLVQTHETPSIINTTSPSTSKLNPTP